MMHGQTKIKFTFYTFLSYKAFHSTRKEGNVKTELIRSNSQISFQYYPDTCSF